MKPNEPLWNSIFEIIDNQMAQNNPPETKETYIRLVGSGYGDFGARRLIGQCVALELFDLMKFRQLINEKRYVQNLRNLPTEPF